MTAAAHLDIDPRGLATLTLNRPDVHNAFDDQLIAHLIDLINEARDNKRTRVLLLASTGKSFSAGADLAWMRRMADASRDDNLRDARKLALLMETLNSFPAPTVAKVQGAVMGGGVGLVSCCDIVVASDDCRFSQLEPMRGIHAAGGATMRFVDRGGWGNAMYHLLTSDEFDAAEAHRIGLVQEVVPAGTQLDRAIEIAEVICMNAPLAVQATKASSARYVRDGEEACVAALGPTQAELASSKDAAEGLAAFRERRTGNFTGS